MLRYAPTGVLLAAAAKLANPTAHLLRGVPRWAVEEAVRRGVPPTQENLEKILQRGEGWDL